MPSGTESLDSVLDEEAQFEKLMNKVSMSEIGIGTSAKELAQEESTTMPFTMNEFANYAKRADEGDYALDWVFVGGGKVTMADIR